MSLEQQLKQLDILAFKGSDFIEEYKEQKQIVRITELYDKVPLRITFCNHTERVEYSYIDFEKTYPNYYKYLSGKDE